MNDEKPAVRTTIVGGRPPGSGTEIGDIPHGMEVLIKKAAVDPPFEARLMEQRSSVAAEVQLELTPAEKTMIDSIPAAQLESIIANTKVNSKLIPILLTGTAAAILIALGIHAFKGCAEDFIRYNLQSLGIQPDIPSSTHFDESSENRERMNDLGSQYTMSKGIRPDLPLPPNDRD